MANSYFSKKLVFKYGNFYMEKMWHKDEFPPETLAIMKPIDMIEAAMPGEKFDITTVRTHKLLFRLKGMPYNPGEYWFYEFVREE